MALVIDVEEFCILKAKVGGHRSEKCPQCKALRAIVIEVNSKTLDMVKEIFERTEPEVRWSPEELVKHINGLKIVQ